MTLLVALGRLAREVLSLLINLFGDVAHDEFMFHLFPCALVPCNYILLLPEARRPGHLAHRGLHVAHLAHDAAEVFQRGVAVEGRAEAAAHLGAVARLRHANR